MDRARQQIGLWCSPLLVVLALAGCTGTKAGDPDLALACELRTCACLAENASIFATKRETTDILWRDNGEAYCPEGFVLTRINEE